MANEEHLAILNQGVKVWNQWRRQNWRIEPDLSEANLSEANLSEVNLSETNLTKADLTKADLTKADLIGSNLRMASLLGTYLVGADLSMADLSMADLSMADLSMADLTKADLTKADLTKADFRAANLTMTKLFGANFERAQCGYTIFADLDLSGAKNLYLVRHKDASSIGLDTIIKSKGKISIEFLEGAGVPKHVIENMQYIVDIPTIQYYSCFISYSTKDDEFAHQLNDRMKREGLRVWFAPEEMKGGQKIHEQLYEAIRYHDKLILVLSEASMNSNWVQSEIRRARKHEREDKRRKLFPISLVPFGEIEKWELMGSNGEDLAEEIKQYYIPDFCQWKDYDKFNTEFEKLLKALRAED